MLKTVRPFKIGEIVMEEEADDPANDLDLQLRDSVTAFLEKKVRGFPPSAQRFARCLIKSCMLLDRWSSSSRKHEQNGKH